MQEEQHRKGAGMRQQSGAFRPIGISPLSEDALVELINAAMHLGGVCEKDVMAVGDAYSRLNLARLKMTQRVAYLESELGWQYGTERSVLKRF
jgi:hypothetical protein